MASTHKHIRSSTANKRPTTAIADGQIALNTNASSPGLFFKDSTGASIIKIGPVHVGSTAPNATPASGGSSGNSTGEIWLDNSLTPVGVKIWNGSAWVNATPVGSTTVQGLLELATDAETQAGSDTARAVTPASLQSKLSDSTSTTSSTTIASSTAVKSAYDLANAALPKSGGTITGNLEIGTTGSLSFEGSTADAFETTIAVTDPTADRTITLPDTTGTVVTTGDSGTVTSTMIADGTIGNADVNASAAIAGTKISPDFGSQTITTTGVVSAALGAAATPSITFTGDLNTGIYSPGADQVAVSTGGVQRINIEADGDINIDGGGVFYDATNNRLGIGTTSPGANLHVAVPNNSQLFLQATDTNPTTIILETDAGTSERIRINNKDGALTFDRSNTSESARIDSSGRLLVGTATTYNVGSTVGATLQAVATSSVPTGSFTRYTNDNDGAIISLGKSRGTSAGSFTVVQSGDIIGNIRFAGADGGDLETQAASIRCEVDGTPGANDMPGKLVLSTTKDGQPSPTAAVTIDSSQRLLVGTSTARANFYNASYSGLLQVETANNENLRVNSFVYGKSASAAGPIIAFGKHRSDSVGGTTVVALDDELGAVTFQGSDGTEFVPGAQITAYVDGTPGANDMPGRLVFSTTADGASSPLERMRIDSAGNVGIGRAPLYELDVYRASGSVIAVCDSDSLANGETAGFAGQGGNRSASVGVYKHAGITNPCGYLDLKTEDNVNSYFWVDNSDQFRISTTVTHIGTTSGTVVGTQTSDERLKNILGPVEYGLDTIKQIEPVRYALKTEPDAEKLGFIAQQVLPFIPQSVFDTGEVIEEGEPTKLGMEYVALIPVLVNAIKELSAEVDALKAQLQ